MRRSVGISKQRYTPISAKMKISQLHSLPNQIKKRRADADDEKPSGKPRHDRTATSGMNGLLSYDNFVKHEQRNCREE